MSRGNMETKSETKVIWAVIALLGAQLLGVDLGQVLAALSGVCQQVDAVKSQGIVTGDVALPILAGLYAHLRTDLKKARAKVGE